MHRITTRLQGCVVACLRRPLYKRSERLNAFTRSWRQVLYCTQSPAVADFLAAFLFGDSAAHTMKLHPQNDREMKIKITTRYCMCLSECSNLLDSWVRLLRPEIIHRQYLEFLPGTTRFCCRSTTLPYATTFPIALSQSRHEPTSSKSWAT